MRQRMVEYVGINPQARTITLDPKLAPHVALAMMEGSPSATVVADRLRGLGLDLPGRPKEFSLTYTPPLKRYSLRCE